MIGFYPALIAITGCPVAAIVLSQIIYWHRGRLRVTRHGHKWLAKSRADLCKETGITLDQYKRVVPLLVAQGWIITERGLFNNKVTPHIRLTEAGHTLMGQLSVGSPTVHLLLNDTNPLGEYPANPITDITTETTTEIGDEKTIASTGAKYDEADPEEQKKGKVEYADMKAKELLAQYTKPLKGSLSTHWQSRMATVYGGYQHPLTQKQVGQLKHLSNYLGDQVKPVVDYVITYWWKFASRAGAIAGTSFPSEPDIGFLLVHHAVAVNLLAEKTAPPVPMVVAQPVQLVATGTDEEPAKKLTPQELATLLDEFKSP